jgi:DNA-binding response OmpR family regulator
MTEQRTILMVEDNRKLLGMNKRGLELLGYKAVTAVSPAAARDAILEHVPDCIVLDVRFGSENGLDLCREIRTLSDVPVLFLTGLGKDSEIVAALEAGGDDYVVKPVSLEVLAARIEALLRRTARITGGIINENRQEDIDEEKFALLTVNLNMNEKKAARLIAQGKSNQEIADSLLYSISSVKRTLTHVYAKTGTSNRDELQITLKKT